MTKMTEQIIIEKLRELSQERQAEVADFIDFLVHRETGRGSLTQEAEHLAQTAFTTLWDNPTDAEYNRQ
ncbi:MAG: DUF2281 domain-containing protein [Nitrospira sp.]|nr:DUF2281 domain-containing protein [Nitrospira sp.]MCP9461516.1 DUF2281 domain-containing protein [Nitrospira sp.]MCP9473970.1 DUF2281 domain-containing protein [Nitrospira sp.]